MPLESISVVYRLREVRNAIVLILQEALFIKNISQCRRSRVMMLACEGYNLKHHEWYKAIAIFIDKG